MPMCGQTEMRQEDRQRATKLQYEKERDLKIAQARLSERIAAAEKKANLSWEAYCKRRDVADTKVWADIAAREKRKKAAAAKERRRSAAGRSEEARASRSKMSCILPPLCPGKSRMS